MAFIKKIRNRSGLASAALAGAAALAALAGVNALAGWLAERRHPARGDFITVNGVRLHYTDRGHGSPIVLIHGNAVTGEDWDTSGVAGLLLRSHRVIIFDRPGFGYSKRPRGDLWTASEQAELLHAALRRLGVERPVVVGHSWGTIVALALAEQYQTDLAGLVLVSGYYFWTLRPDSLLLAPAVVPVLGDILSYTIWPLLGRLQMPLLKRAMFTPAEVPDRFEHEYSPAMALRPWQIRASAMDGTLMIPSAMALRRRYRELTLPTIIIAGEGDRIVFSRSARRLRDAIPGAVLQVVPGAGHMLHHLVADLVAEDVERVLTASRLRPAGHNEGASEAGELHAEGAVG